MHLLQFKLYANCGDLEHVGTWNRSFFPYSSLWISVPYSTAGLGKRRKTLWLLIYQKKGAINNWRALQIYCVLLQRIPSMFSGPVPRVSTFLCRCIFGPLPFCMSSDGGGDASISKLYFRIVSNHQSFSFGLYFISNSCRHRLQCIVTSEFVYSSILQKHRKQPRGLGEGNKGNRKSI